MSNLLSHSAHEHPERALWPGPWVKTHDWPEAPAAPTTLGFEVPVAIPHTAIDAVIAGLESPRAAERDELRPALEDAVKQLLSASLTPATD